MKISGGKVTENKDSADLAESVWRSSRLSQRKDAACPALRHDCCLLCQWEITIWRGERGRPCGFKKTKNKQHPAEQRRAAETLGKPVLPVPLGSGGTDLLQTLTAPQIYGTNVSLAAVKTRRPDRPDALLHLKAM